MRCKDFEERVSAYLDGELGPLQARQFEAHMRSCAVCSELVDGVERVRCTLQTLGVDALPAATQLRLNGGLQDELVQPGWRLPRAVVVGLTVAAALAIVLWPESGADRPLPAEGAHLADVAPLAHWQRPVRWASTTSSGWPGAPPQYSQAQVRTVAF